MQTVFCVQTFWRAGRRLEQGQLRQYADEAPAREAGLALSKRMPAVVVYAITGEPEADFWDEPRLLERYGAVPAGIA